jgi:glycosyltransferase involved in cell wall biosynthesis
MIRFSCLISVYSGTDLPYFKVALQSILDQTVLPDEIIVIIDGPVSKELEEYVYQISLSSAPVLRIVKIDKNVGAGPARNKGIECTNYEWIAVMDCDDYSVPTRFEKQIAVLEAHPHTDFISSLSDEYSENFEPENFIATKKCPQSSALIRKRLNYNCCITNPTIFFKKKLWEQTRGYASFRYLNEDHLFFLKAARQNANFFCVQEPLLKVRIGKKQRKRRSGFRLFWTDVKFRSYCLKNNLMDVKGFSVLFLLLIRRFTPPFMVSFMHRLWRSI